MDTSPTPSPKARCTLPLASRRFLTTETFEIKFPRPPTLNFRPGQRIQLMRKALARDYSMISTPADAHISFCVRLIKGGRFSVLLAAAPPGTHFSFSRPAGHFIYRPSLRPPVFVATGTGIAPFVSMARAGISNFTLLHGVRSESETYYRDLFQARSGAYIPCISGDSHPGSVQSGAFSGRVTDYLSTRLPDGPYDFYLCGRREMIHDVVHLVDDRFQGSHIYTEIFH